MLPGIGLPFDDEDLAGATVDEVLANPDRFEDATLADPLEGVEYGRGKAKIMRRADGGLWINSFAHGRTVYELKYNFSAPKAQLDEAPADKAADWLICLVLAGDLDEDEIDVLRILASKKAGVGRRVLSARVKRALQEQATQRRHEERKRHLANRRDPRPQVPAPPSDAPWTPQMTLLNCISLNLT